MVRFSGIGVLDFFTERLSLTLKDFLPPPDLLHTVAEWFCSSIWLRDEGMARVRGGVVDRQGFGPFAETRGASYGLGAHAVFIGSFAEIGGDLVNAGARRLADVDRRAATI